MATKKKKKCRTVVVKDATVEVCVIKGKKAVAAGKAFDKAMAKARKVRGAIVGSF